MVEEKEKLFEDILSSIDYEEEVRAKVKKIPDEVKTLFFDRFFQKIFSIEDKKKAPIVCDICILLAIEIKDNVRLYQSYLQRGLSNTSLGFKKKAREDLNKAIELLPSLGVDTNSGVICSSPFKDVFMWLSDLEYMMGSDVEINGQQNKALEHYRNALNTLLTLLPENKEGEAWYFEKLGAIYASMEDFDNSIKNYSRALKCPELLKRNKKRYEIYTGMGLTYQNWGKFLEAEKSFNLAVDSVASIGDNEAQANGYLNLASLYFSKLNRFEDARICLDKVKEKTKNPITSLTALQIESGVNLAFGLYQEALACNEKVAEYYQSIGDIRSEAFALSSAASDLSLMGKNEEAVEKLNYILNLYTNLNDKRQIINTHYQIAQEKSILGDYEAALDALNQALVIASEIENPSMEANSFLLMGSIHLYRTLSLMVAEACYSRALDKSCEANNQYFEVQSLIGLGSVNLKKGQLIKAEEHIKQAIDVCGSSESMLITKAGAYQQLADVYAAQKRYSYAKERFIEATEIYKRLGLHRQEAATYRDISMLLDEAEEPEEALSYNDKAIEMYRKMGLEDELLSSLNNSSLILYNSGRFEEARRILENAISDFDLETSDPTTLAYSYMGIGAIYKRTGNEQLALSNFLKATESLDSVRSKITSGDLRLTFQGRESTLYDAVIKSFFLQGHFEKSLEYVEKAKSRVLIEQIRLARLRKPQLLDDAIGKKEDELLAELNAIIKEGKSGKRAYDADLEIRNLWDRMERCLPASIEIKEYLSLRRGDFLKTCEFIELLKDRRNSAILEYYVLKDRLLIFLVNQNSKEPEVYSKEVDKNLLKQKCYNLISTIENRSAESLDMLLSEMSSYILDPVVDALKGLEHIHIVPHSFLHELPIHALPLDGQAMIDRFSISYSHSASVLKYCMARPNKKLRNALVIGYPDPDLIYPKIEVKKISEIFGCEAYVGKDAVKEIYSNINGKDIVSFSCHAKFDADNAMASSIVLSSPYVFSWDNVPGNESERLLRFLIDYLDIIWAENAEIRKFDGGKTIHISKDENSAEIFIDEKKEKATLKNCDSRTHDLEVEKKNGKLNIYSRSKELKVTARELFKMKLSAELVSLSACESGKSEEKTGDEMFGLVRSIIFAGARSVLASLWRVDDLAACLTIVKFYEKLYSEGLNKSQALREAQIYLKGLTAKEVMKIIKDFSEENLVSRAGVNDLANITPETKIFDHVYYWSPFIIIGDWC